VDLQGLALPVSVAELLGRLRTLWVQQEVDYILDDMPELVRESHEGTRHIKEIARACAPSPARTRGSRRWWT
jgi:hypothetical protein